MTIWFTSDTHFGHKNIIKYCNRPFVDEIEMNRTIMQRWNALVHPYNDTIFHLGDFSFQKPEVATAMLAGLTGRNKILVLGNHDKLTRSHYMRMGWDDVLYEADLGAFGYPQVKLAHHPDYTLFNKPDEYQLCGHVHEAWKSKYDRILNVGVDVWKFYPVPLTTVLRELKLARPD